MRVIEMPLPGACRIGAVPMFGRPALLAAAALGVELAAFATLARGDESLTGIACRSVHLQYAPMPREAQALYAEVEVEQSARGTYFCVLGFNQGYFGLQELANGKKLLIFSVWDPTSGDDPEKVAPEDRVKLLHRDERVRVGRFGGEGTGGQSFFDFDWKPATRYRFLVTARAEGERTAYTGWFFEPESARWVQLVTFSTKAKRSLLGGAYSFVEDFLRNRKSVDEARVARYGNACAQTADGAWVALDQARFTADSNRATNIDAGCRDGLLYLATGGTTENRGTKLLDLIPSCKTAPTAPADLPEAR